MIFIIERESVYCAVRTEYIHKFYVLFTQCVMSVVWMSKQTAIISLYSINCMILIIETVSVYCAVRKDSFNKIHVNLS